MKDFYRPICLLNPFGGGDSSSATSSTNITATGTGTKATNNSANSVQTGDSSIAVGSNAKYQEAGSLDLSGVKGNIVLNDPTELTKLADDFAATTQQIAGNASSANLAANQNFLQGLVQLAQSQQTGGLTPVMKTFLWLGFGGLILLALIFRRRN